MATKRSATARLQKYRQKRDFDRTPEPAGQPRQPPPGQRSYVVQKHYARNLHYDLRLEWEGTLLSWAVPKGPCLDPSQKRLAIQVEDHPLEYQHFEGAIPQGQYGAGQVIVWDRGTWEPVDDPAADYRSGKFKFVLHGEKLRGGWMLVRLPEARWQSKQPHWLLFKERDEFARPLAEGDILLEQPDSVLAASVARPQRSKCAKSKRAAGSAGNRQSPVLKNLPGIRQGVLARAPRPQLATLVAEPPAGDEWLHEIKFDGYRMLCRRDGDRVTIISRTGLDWTAKFPSLVTALKKLPAERLLLDGEVVVLDPQGRSNFQALQNALRLHRSVVYYAFDLLYQDGYDLTQVPLVDRKGALQKLLSQQPKQGSLQYSDHLAGSAQEFHEYACSQGLEGIISKRANAVYSPGRSSSWLKCKCRLGQEVVIGGYTPPAGSRVGFGALLVGYYDDQKKLRYAGRVGTGFDDQRLTSMLDTLRQRQTAKSPFVGAPIPKVARAHWVRPDLVAEVEFSNWTDEGLLRQAAFKGLREDKPAEEIVREEPQSRPRRKSATSSRKRKAKPDVPAARDDWESLVRLTHPERVVYPELGLQKRDVARYIALVAPRMLPLIAGRPLSLVRCPGGVAEKCFFQKHPPPGLSSAVQRISVREKGEVAEYLVIHNLEGLLAVVQFGVLEIHTWQSQAQDLERPDQLIFDLDPAPDVSWRAVCEAAIGLRDLLAELKLTSFVKLSGGKGLHLHVPIRPKLGWSETKAFCRAVSVVLERAAPDRFTLNMSKASRPKRIFIDYLRNERGATSIAPYSMRARASGAVALPIAWDELQRVDAPDAFTISALLKDPARLQIDPWQALPKIKQSLTKKMLARVGLS
jgi:bifunctional non-homologous end joining protein LigD